MFPASNYLLITVTDVSVTKLKTDQYVL